MRNKTSLSGAGSTGAKAKETRSAAPAHLFTHEEIAARARQVWERRGRPEGQDDAIWYEAERQLRGDDLKTTEDRRFAKPEAILDADGDPNDEIDQRLDDLANPRKDRSATSL